jgi:hypothetical protein
VSGTRREGVGKANHAGQGPVRQNLANSSESRSGKIRRELKLSSCQELIGLQAQAKLPPKLRIQSSHPWIHTAKSNFMVSAMDDFSGQNCKIGYFNNLAF